jgi:hypothetical protein
VKTPESKALLAAVLAVLQVFAILIFASVTRISVGGLSFLFWSCGIVWLAIFIVWFASRWQHTKAAQPTPESMRQPHAAHAAIVADKGRESLLDIGFVAFWGKNTIVPYRTKPLPTSVETLQPFIQVHNRRRRQCHVVFEILDDNDKLIFSREIHKTYPKGVHFITPPARLRLGDQIPDGMWALRIRFNGQVLALHHFGWHVDDVMSVDGHITADGEIDEQVASMLVDDYSAPLSLDDLLATSEGKAKGQS